MHFPSVLHSDLFFAKKYAMNYITNGGKSTRCSGKRGPLCLTSQTCQCECASVLQTYAKDRLFMEVRQSVCMVGVGLCEKHELNDKMGTCSSIKCPRRCSESKAVCACAEYSVFVYRETAKHEDIEADAVCGGFYWPIKL